MRREREEGPYTAHSNGNSCQRYIELRHKGPKDVRSSTYETQLTSDSAKMMSTESTISAMTAAEYSESVEEWLKQAYQWQIMALGFPSYLAYQFHMMQQQNAGKKLCLS